MGKRLASELKKLGIILGAGILYYIFVTVTGFKIPCPFNLATGLLCPGCGITRMALSLARFDFASAFGYNKALFVTLPILFLFLLFEEIKYIKSGIRRFSKATQVFLTLEAVFLVIFGIVRNII